MNGQNSPSWIERMARKEAHHLKRAGGVLLGLRLSKLHQELQDRPIGRITSIEEGEKGVKFNLIIDPDVLQSAPKEFDWDA